MPESDPELASSYRAHCRYNSTIAFQTDNTFCLFFRLRQIICSAPLSPSWCGYALFLCMRVAAKARHPS